MGLEELEEAQKKQQKVKADEKKVEKKATKKADIAADAPPVAPTEEAAALVEKKEKKASAKKSRQAGSVQTGAPKRRGQKYNLNKRLVDRAKKYSIEEAIAALKKMTPAKFDEAVELHLNVDKAGLKGEVALPHSTGKAVRVQVVDDAALAAIAAGKIEFDVLVAHPSFMPKIAPLAKILGPRGLMPSPKSGTISDKPESLAKKFASGTLKWKTEGKAPLIHQMVGKHSAPDKALGENVAAFIASVGPSHIASAYLTSTMSPSVQLEIS